MALVSCIDLDSEDIRNILDLVLHEFPVTEMRYQLPTWMSAIDASHPIKASIYETVKACSDKIKKAGDVKDAVSKLADNEYVKSYNLDEIDLGTGKARLTLKLDDKLYYEILSELTGFDIDSESALIELLKELSASKSRFDREGIWNRNALDRRSAS